ncbi:hypothetical protein ACHAXT_005974 [Thalassiosira profunda]
MDALTDEVFFAVAAFLAPADLLRLASTCARFGSRPVIVEPPHTGKRRKKIRVEQWRRTSVAKASGATSLAEAAAKKIVDANSRWTDSELLHKKGSETWLAVYHRLYLLRTRPIWYRRIGTGLNYVKGDYSHVRQKRDITGHFGAAICQEVMTEGRNYMEFTITGVENTFRLGVMRPVNGWDAKGDKQFWKEPGDHDKQSGYDEFCIRQTRAGVPGFVGSTHQSFHIYGSFYRPAAWEVCLPPGYSHVVGLLLDLNTGSLMQSLNGGNFRVIQSGLVGHFCWAGEVGKDRWANAYSDRPNEGAIKIARAPVPDRLEDDLQYL